MLVGGELVPPEGVILEAVTSDADFACVRQGDRGGGAEYDVVDGNAFFGFGQEVNSEFQVKFDFIGQCGLPEFVGYRRSIAESVHEVASGRDDVADMFKSSDEGGQFLEVRVGFVEEIDYRS